MADFAGATTASGEQMGAMSDPPWDCGCTRCATTESPDEQIAAEVQGIDIVLSMGSLAVGISTFGNI
jgi:hypothetical protein